MTINNLPGAIWPILFAAIYAGLQVFVSAQWPEAPPATVLGLMTALGVAMGALKVLWPEPRPETPAALPLGVQAQAGLAGPGPDQAGLSWHAAERPQSKIVRFLI